MRDDAGHDGAHACILRHLLQAVVRIELLEARHELNMTQYTRETNVVGSGCCDKGASNSVWARASKHKGDGGKWGKGARRGVLCACHGLTLLP
jgi:hypothetical protein